MVKQLHASPLRYPGGKAKLSTFLQKTIYLNGVQGGVYAEPFAGGAGAALTLLFNEHVDEIAINDADFRIWAFWQAVTNQSSELEELINNVPLTIDEWHRQKDIYQNPSNQTELAVGFATLFLNRCNRSGIIVNGGPIGGFEQTGNWKIDARFNREGLISRISNISEQRHRITLSNKDAIEFLHEMNVRNQRESVFVYLDPPYFEKGRKLYLNYYEPSDHAALAKFLTHDAEFNWVLTYDDCREIVNLYSGFEIEKFTLRYSLQKCEMGTELLIRPKEVALGEFCTK